MTFKIKNVHLQITEDDVRKCASMKSLKNWEEEISKQLVVMDSKIRDVEANDLQTKEDKDNLNKTTHARDLQKVLLKIIQNKLEELRTEYSNSMEALFYTFAEKDLPEEMYNTIMKKVHRAQEGSI